MIRLSDRQKEILAKTMLSGIIPEEQELFFQQVEMTNLDPFSRQIYAQKRWDKAKARNVISIGVSIDGMRLQAERSGKYCGQIGPFWCGKDGVWRDVWLEEGPPEAAKIGVLKEGFKDPLWAVARYSSYVQTYRDKETKKEMVGQFWGKMSDLMLAKVAEALALRRAFPAELGGLYAREEGILEEEGDKIDEETGEITGEDKAKGQLKEVFSPPPPAAPPAPPSQPMPEGMRKAIEASLNKAGVARDSFKAYLGSLGWLPETPKGFHLPDLSAVHGKYILEHWSRAVDAWEKWQAGQASPPTTTEDPGKTQPGLTAEQEDHLQWAAQEELEAEMDEIPF